METVLSGEWELARGPLRSPASTELTDRTALEPFGPVQVPGHVQLQIGLEDPFLDTPEVTAVNHSEWIYTRTFATPATAGRALLAFDGVDYYCDVFVNGAFAGHHAGMHSDWELDVTELLAPAGEENRLDVAVSCPWRIVEHTHHLSSARFEDSFDPRTELLKGKHALQWDGWPLRGQALQPFGLWRDVKLVVRSGPTLLRVAAATRLVGADSADVELALEWWSDAQEPVEVELDVVIAPETFDGAAQLVSATATVAPGRSDTLLRVAVADPQLWWTWDSGPQNLYRAAVNGVETVFGIRTFERDPSTLVTRINGRRIFLKGVWNPPTQFEGAATVRDVERDLELLRESNGNLYNVHGYVGRPELYDAADRLGIVLFQQLPFHQFGPGGLVEPDHPRREPFTRHALEECEAVVRRHRGHASIVVWGAFAEARQNGEWWFADYTDLNAAIERMLLALDRDVEYHPSFCDFGETHLWQGAIGFGEYADHNDHNAAFISEFGCPAPPVVESLRAFMPEAALWGHEAGRDGRLRLPIDAAEWSYAWGHDYEGMTASIARILKWADRNPPTLERFVDAAGWYQWLGIRYCAEVYRRKRYADIAGVRMWSLRDSSPGAKCAPLDYWQRPKMGLQGLREAYVPLQLSIDERQPLHPLAAGSRWERDAWVVNDTERSETLTLAATLIDPAGNRLAHVEHVLEAGADDAVHVPIGFDLPRVAGGYLVRLAATRPDGSEAARSDNWLNVAPRAFETQLRVLLLGQERYNAPLLDALGGVGGIELTVLDETNRDPQDARWSETLADDYDVIWLTGWERAVHAFTQTELANVAAAVEAGAGLVHTGGQGSFHGGDSLGPQLDATPLEAALPVTLRRNDTVWDLPPAIADTGARERLGVALEQLPSRGYSRTDLRPGSELLATVAGFPLLAVGSHGAGATVALTAALLHPRRLLKTVEVETGEQEATVGAPWERDDIREYSVHWSGNQQLFIGLLAAAARRAPADAPAALADRLQMPVFELLAGLEPTTLGVELEQLDWHERDGESRGSVLVTNTGATLARIVRGSVTSEQTMSTRFRDGFVDLLPGEQVRLRFEAACRPEQIGTLEVSAQNCPAVAVAVLGGAALPA